MIQLKKLPADSLRGRRCNFLSEPLERRTLLTTIVSQWPGLNVNLFTTQQFVNAVSGTMATTEIYVEDTKSSTPVSGTVSIEWYNGAQYGISPTTDIGGAPIVSAPIAATSLAGAGVNLTFPLDINAARAAGTNTVVPYKGGYLAVLVAEFTGSGYPDTWGAIVQDVTFGAGSQVAFIQQPSDSAAGDKIQPPITVAVEDSSGAYETTSTDSITLALSSSSTGTGTLSGTTTEAAVAGLATFSDLSISANGAYTLTATDTTNPSFTAATSMSFNITAGKLVFLAPLATAQTADEPLQPTIKVELEDGSGNPITSEDGTIVTLAPIGFTADNPITGNTAALSGGIATFRDVVLTKAGTYQLQASDPDGDAMGTSNKFGIGGDKLKFLVQPKNGDLNSPISVKVEALTSKGKVDTTLGDSLQLGLNVVSGGANAALSGTTMVAMVGGIATFNSAANLSINAAGTYMLSATALNAGSTDDTVTAATSGQFTIAPDHLIVKPEPTAQVDALDPIPLSVELVDSKGKVDTGENGDQVQLNLNIVRGPAAAKLGGTTTATSTAGVASFPASAAPTIDSPGTYTLTAVESGQTTPKTSVTSKSIKVGGYKLLAGIIAREEPSATEDIPMEQAEFTVNFLLRNSKGKSVTSTDGLPNVQLTLNTVSGSGTLEGTTQTSPTILGGGPVVYNFSGVAITSPGSYTLTATAFTTPGESIPASAISPATTAEFKAISYQLIPGGVTATSPTPSMGSGHSGGDVLLEDEAITTGALLALAKTAFENDQTGIQPNAWVGVEVSLINVPNAKNPAPTVTPVLSGTTVAPLDNAGSEFTNLSINAPGRYELQFTEVISAANAPFDPAAFTPVATTEPVTSEVFFIVPDAVVR